MTSSFKLSSPHLPIIIPFKLDFAVCSKNYSAINLRNNNDHIIELDNITITESLFKTFAKIFTENLITEYKNKIIVLNNSVIEKEYKINKQKRFNKMF